MKKTMKMEILTLLFLLIHILETSAQDSGNFFNQSSYPSLPYVEVEPLGIVRLIRGRHSMYALIRVDQFDEEEKVIREKIEEVETACEKLPSCDDFDLIERLKSLLGECKESKLKLFSSLGMRIVNEKNNGTKNNRQKRGFWKWWTNKKREWYGIMTQVDAEIIEKQLSNMNENIGNFSIAIHNQTSIINMGLRKIGIFFHDLNGNIEILEEKSGTLGAKIDKLREYHITLRKKALITDACVEIGMAIMELDKRINIVLESITMARKGIINPKLLAPRQLMETINDIRRKYGQEMPIKLHDDNYFEYLRISEIVIGAMNCSLVYIVKVPILQSGSYSAYQILPVPKSLDNGTAMVYVDIVDEYIMTDVENNDIISIDEHYLSECKKYKSNYFCNRARVNTKKETTDSCLKAVLGSAGRINEQICKYKVVKVSKSLWIPLPSGDEWVYVAKVRERIAIHCGKEKENLTIHGTQKLKVKPKCVVMTEGLKLYSEFLRRIDNDYKNSLIDFHFKGNLTSFENWNLDLALIDLPEINTQEVQAGEFTKIGDRFDDVTKKLEDLRNKMIEDGKREWIPPMRWWKIFGIGLIVLFLLFIIIRMFVR